MIANATSWPLRTSNLSDEDNVNGKRANRPALFCLTQINRNHGGLNGTVCTGGGVQGKLRLYITFVVFKYFKHFVKVHMAFTLVALRAS